VRARIITLLFVALIPSSLVAQEKRAITIDDYFTQADLFEVAFSANNVVYTEARWQEATDDRKTDIWVARIGGIPAPLKGVTKVTAKTRLTSDRANDRSPQIASGYAYFLGNRKRDGEQHPPYDGKTQVWRVLLDGTGTPEAVTRVVGGIDSYHIAHLMDATDKRSHSYIYCLTHRDKIEDDWSGLRSKYNKLDYGHGQNRHGQIWKVDPRNFRIEKVMEIARHIHEFAVAPGGKHIAMITTPDDKVVSFEGQSRVDVWDSETGKIRTIPEDIYRKQAASPYAWLEKIAWNSDGNALAFGVIFDGYPAEIIVADLRGEKARTIKLPRPNGMHVRGYGSPIQWTEGKKNELMFLAEEKGRVRLCVAQEVLSEKATEFRILTDGDVVVENFHALTQNAFAVIMGTPTKFAEVYANYKPSPTPRFDSGGFPSGKQEKPIQAFRQLTNVNPQAEQWKLPQLSVVSWKGAGGQTVEGILELPPDYKQGDKVPLVVEIHGGPTTASLYKLQYWIYGRTLLPARGYAVLCPNYRGSTGYGDKFTTDLIGRENDLDVEDILKGVDALVDRGIADPDKLAVSGWSNGGYLTNCIITKTNRFKAAISGAGIVDAVMEWGSNDEPAYTMVFKHGLPWTNAAQYHKASPTYDLGKVRTPTLIHVGANDERCPPGQSRMLYRALKEYLKVPTELIVYPGEGHGISKMRNRRAKMEWDLAWLDRYVLGKK
jgi:dipeptidyl aminopeptidase/acylaminoacyl peptidase